MARDAAFLILHVSTPVCKNCSHTFDGSYGNPCGQREITGRFTWKGLAGDFLTQVFTLELPLPYTLRELFLHPVRFCESYIRGKRRPFVPAIHPVCNGSRFFIFKRNTILAVPIGGHA